MRNHTKLRRKHSKVRVLYLAGPGDVIGTYRHWREGRDDPSQVAVTYSGLFYDACRRMGVDVVVVATHPRRDSIRDCGWTLLHRPSRTRNWRGPFFHLGAYVQSLFIVWRSVLQRCDVLLISQQSHLVPYIGSRVFGKRLVLTEHCVIWPKIRKPRGVWKIVHWLDRIVFRKQCDAIMSISLDVTNQIQVLTGRHHAPITQFLPFYRREQFMGIPEPVPGANEFRVLFAGRVEHNKGVFDIVRIAERLNSTGHENIVFDIAGDGGAMRDLERAVKDAGLGSRVALHGYCEKPRMHDLLVASHAVIVPTSSTFVEGFNKVVAEAVLAHRPFITSDVCPALEYVREAGIEVPVDNVDAYANAILRLAEDRDLYKQYVASAKRLSEQFYDPDRHWGTVFQRVMYELFPELEEAEK